MIRKKATHWKCTTSHTRTVRHINEWAVIHYSYLGPKIRKSKTSILLQALNKELKHGNLVIAHAYSYGCSNGAKFSLFNTYVQSYSIYIHSGYLYSVLSYLYSVSSYLYSISSCLYSATSYTYSVNLFIFSLILITFSLILFIFNLILFVFSHILFIFSQLIDIQSYLNYIQSHLVYIQLSTKRIFRKDEYWHNQLRKAFSWIHWPQIMQYTVICYL